MASLRNIQNDLRLCIMYISVPSVSGRFVIRSCALHVHAHLCNERSNAVCDVEPKEK